MATVELDTTNEDDETSFTDELDKTKVADDELDNAATLPVLDDAPTIDDAPCTEELAMVLDDDMACGPVAELLHPIKAIPATVASSEIVILFMCWVP